MRKRETWPDDYKTPNFIRSPSEDLSFPKPRSHWNYSWSAVCLTAIIVGLALVSEEGGGSSRFTIELVTLSIAGVAAFGWIATHNGLREVSPSVLYDHLLKEVAFSRSLQRTWSEEDLKQLKRHVELGVNEAQNYADEVWEKRKSKWIQRTFWRWHGNGTISRPEVDLRDELRYSSHLLREVEQRLNDQRQAKKESANVGSFNLSHQVSCAITRLNLSQC